MVVNNIDPMGVAVSTSPPPRFRTRRPAPRPWSSSAKASMFCVDRPSRSNVVMTRVSPSIRATSARSNWGREARAPDRNPPEHRLAGTLVGRPQYLPPDTVTSSGSSFQPRPGYSRQQALPTRSCPTGERPTRQLLTRLRHHPHTVATLGTGAIIQGFVPAINRLTAHPPREDLTKRWGQQPSMRASATPWQSPSVVSLTRDSLI